MSPLAGDRGGRRQSLQSRLGIMIGGKGIDIGLPRLGQRPLRVEQGNLIEFALRVADARNTS